MKIQEEIIHSARELSLAASRHVDEAVPAAIGKRLSEVCGAPTPSLSLTECHVIDAIGSNDRIKAAEIAQKLGLTRGGVSKIVAHLEGKGYVSVSSKPGNKKERGLALTALGRQAYLIHRELHDAQFQKWVNILSGYSTEELELLNGMLTKVLDEFTD
jgi:DNA-binding MarR family transcriptional regulator